MRPFGQVRERAEPPGPSGSGVILRRKLDPVQKPNLMPPQQLCNNLLHKLLIRPPGVFQCVYSAFKEPDPIPQFEQLPSWANSWKPYSHTRSILGGGVGRPPLLLDLCQHVGKLVSQTRVFLVQLKVVAVQLRQVRLR